MRPDEYLAERRVDAQFMARCMRVACLVWTLASLAALVVGWHLAAVGCGTVVLVGAMICSHADEAVAQIDEALADLEAEDEGEHNG